MDIDTTKITFSVGDLSNEGIRAIINGLQLDRVNVQAVEFVASTGSLEVTVIGSESVSHVSAFVADMKRSNKLISRKVICENVSTTKYYDQNIDAALKNSNDVQVLAAGLTGLRGPTLKLFRFFEQEFQALAMQFDAEDNHYPAMIPREILEKVGYLDNFPQHVTFCCHFPDSLPILESVASQGSSNGNLLQPGLISHIKEPNTVLSPAVCLACYPQQRDIILEPDQILTLTMQNRVFRYEGNRFRPLARGWDYTVRDIVFFGGYEALCQLRQQVMDLAMQLCKKLDLSATIEVAHDPFFLQNNRDKALYQRMGEVKYELLLHIPDKSEALAAASFNLHRDFYTSVYNTRQADGQLAESACMGFGIDRWVYGFLSQKGINPADWPKFITEFKT